MGLLRVARTEQMPTLIERRFERMDAGFLLLTVQVREPRMRANAPLHWFLADRRKPPLELAVEPSDGMFRELTFFMDAPLTGLGATESGAVLEGIPFFETGLWTGRDYHVEEVGEVEAALSGQDLRLMIAGQSVHETILLNAQFGILVDSDRQFSGVLLPSLSPAEQDELRRAQLL